MADPPWSQEHPDPNGDNLRLLGKVLEAYVDQPCARGATRSYLGSKKWTADDFSRAGLEMDGLDDETVGGQRWAVFIGTSPRTRTLSFI